MAGTYFCFSFLGRGETDSICYVGHYLAYCTSPGWWMIMSGAVGGMSGRENWSTQRKPSPVPLCSPQITHDLTWARTYAATVGSRQLTSWAKAWPTFGVYILAYIFQTGFLLCYATKLQSVFIYCVHAKTLCLDIKYCDMMDESRNSLTKVVHY
jgi:hypothetical protein